jgi:4-amino-4-deoxychorismate lyase
MSGFSLIETMRFEPDTGVPRFNLHMARLRNSAKVLGFAGIEKANSALGIYIREKTEALRLRLELFPDGKYEITSVPYVPLADDIVWRIRISSKAMLNSTDPILRHKTSKRTVYEAARAEYARDEADEVVLLNEKGEVCEGTITNVFLDDGSGTLLTPPLSSGCLAGILRTSLICQKKARNQRLTVDDLRRNPLYVGNSLRGLIRARLV